MEGEEDGKVTEGQRELREWTESSPSQGEEEEQHNVLSDQIVHDFVKMTCVGNRIHAAMMVMNDALHDSNKEIKDWEIEVTKLQGGKALVKKTKDWRYAAKEELDDSNEALGILAVNAEKLMIGDLAKDVAPATSPLQLLGDDFDAYFAVINVIRPSLLRKG